MIFKIELAVVDREFVGFLPISSKNSRAEEFTVSGTPGIFFNASARSSISVVEPEPPSPYPNIPNEMSAIDDCLLPFLHSKHGLRHIRPDTTLS